MRGQNRKRYNYKTVQILIVLFCSCVLFPRSSFGADSLSNVSLDSSRFFSSSRFNFFEDQLSMKVDMQIQPSVRSYMGVIMSIEMSDNSLKNIILNWNAEGVQEMLLTYGYSVFKHEFQPQDSLFSTGREQFDFVINFKKDILTVSTNHTRFEFINTGFTINNGYKFLLLPEPRYSSNGMNAMQATPKEVTMTVEKVSKRPTWFWYVLIIVVDLLIFFVVQMSRKHKRKQKLIHQASSSSSSSDSIFEMTLPTRSAIYLFGVMQIYDSKGDDITKKFSPLLKELLSILILHSKENGVSSEQLKEMLWYDKSDSSARNNRAVNIGKLRALLDSVGEYEISTKDGYWYFTTDKIFIDYIEYERITAEPQPLTKDNFSLLIALTKGGVLLLNSDYQWSDAYKSKVSDTIIDSLMKYSYALDPINDSELLVAIADAISRYDTVSEYALYLKCTTFTAMNKAYMAKAAYEKFCKEYKTLYNEDFNRSFVEVLNDKSYINI